MKKLLGILSIAVIVTCGLVFRAEAEIDSAKCEVQSTQMVVVGDDISSTILAQKGNRAWAEINLNQDAAGVATSSVFLNFNEGEAATLNSHKVLSTTTPSVEFGRKSRFPYVGEVTGITNGSASTTVRVIECLY